ncbi:proline dehydrogenase family protein [Zobellia galactanivorans]|uniref:Carbapenem antibiotics biosynthesis protein carD n=1 Tax=Zobellia galactanivorans (strain DSM 12802 / CCUG 47099 / CIP 106680 / NCIMB 13871 / Dsij) TaxID=63186 RepID=G0L454_ZOBGA|nr:MULTISPECIES: proline dehydrogenase family protein [Zobellia]MBU3025753.1 proline dehydrogenase family protein [Zobellia galactanivorans]MDO6809011.1 proline dehydrogenase family protein [Zobellia galactanivorans]OWW25982.1 proline dehydrogenase [Zobellia sp. OII3]CAZ98670.1 Carbapenem antibiotics biosynthesis protein carD [Zobellia galactanivorans]
MKRIFEDTATAFALKTDSELERAYFLFRMIANEPLVRIGTAMTNFAIKAHLPVEGLIRATVFDHFCGGVSEKDCMPVVDKMYTKNVCSVLDYSVEGKDTEDPFDDAMDMILKVLDFVKEKDAIPFAVFKPTGYGRFALFQKLSEGKSLSDKEQEEWERVVNRFDKTCKKAHDLDVSLLIDAEESWMQDAADQLVEEMMRKYNKEKAIVFNTLQMYRWDRLDYLKQLEKRAEQEGFKIGVKVVRGAYMEKENERAEEKGYRSPICSSKKETDENFDNAVAYIVNHLDSISIFAGTHNEESSYKLMALMAEKGIAPNDNRVWFGQLYGMSDHISFNLAHEDYNVAKYLPFGPVRDVMPYLIRRAEENTSVAGQTTRELSLLKKERQRRKI